MVPSLSPDREEQIAKEFQSKGLKAEATKKIEKVTMDLGTIGECQICFEEKDIYFAIIPCGHGDICEKCLRTMKRNAQRCPTCRGRIADYMKLYLNRQVQVDREIITI